MSFDTPHHSRVGKNGRIKPSEEIPEESSFVDGYRIWVVDGRAVKKIYCYDGLEFYDRGHFMRYLREQGHDFEESYQLMNGLTRLEDRKISTANMKGF